VQKCPILTERFAKETWRCIDLIVATTPFLYPRTRHSILSLPQCICQPAPLYIVYNCVCPLPTARTPDTRTSDTPWLSPRREPDKSRVAPTFASDGAFFCIRISACTRSLLISDSRLWLATAEADETSAEDTSSLELNREIFSKVSLARRDSPAECTPRDWAILGSSHRLFCTRIHTRTSRHIVSNWTYSRKTPFFTGLSE